ncbi:Alpha/Beta hydrolase protein [Fennellomyces sp. T-0311]|nr:Alpha/Beta hydrolase protein [Fennellomyces sp. T-0311]
MFRNLIPKLADEFHLVAPDYVGFGLSSAPSADEFEYTFENLSNVVYKFVKTIGLNKFSIYIQDYGAPIGLRLALKHPELIQGIVTQNGNAYKEGLGAAWAPINAYQNDRTKENEDKIRSILFSLEGNKWQYTHGVNPKHLPLIDPDTYHLDTIRLERPGNDKIQLDLFYDYQNNVKLYDEFHKYFREYKPPLLAIWGDKDEFFPAAGAKAFKKDLPDAKIQLVDGGHFILEYYSQHVADEIKKFLGKNN